MNAIYSLLADLVVVIHAAYVAFVVLGELTILAGWLLRWSWVRNFAFRVSHLVLIGVVAAESLIDITCPLTDLEDWLRRLASQPVEKGTFIGRWMHELIFIDAPSWAFTLAYCLFAALVAATLYLIPPRWPARTGTTSNKHPETTDEHG